MRLARADTSASSADTRFDGTAKRRIASTKGHAMTDGYPGRHGFNFQWMLVGDGGRPVPADERALDFLAEHGFDFVRIPTDYRLWTRDFDYRHPDEAIFGSLDGYLAACRARGIHLSLNLHRAPGYCITRNELEKHNLWLDVEAQDAFVSLWEGFARRYVGVLSQHLGFDLINEPPAIGRPGTFTRARHAALIPRTVAAIREIDPMRPMRASAGTRTICGRSTSRGARWSGPGRAALVRRPVQAVQGVGLGVRAVAVRGRFRDRRPRAPRRAIRGAAWLPRGHRSARAYARLTRPVGPGRRD